MFNKSKQLKTSDVIDPVTRASLNNLALPGSRWGEYKDHKYNIRLWSKFFFQIFEPTDSKVLDFGCGATWCSTIGTTLGYQIINLDVDSREVRENFGLYAQILNQEIIYYNGDKIPFADNSFSAIIAKASIMKLEGSEFSRSISELIRISQQHAIWYISSKGMYRSFINELALHAELGQKIKDKKIRFIPWTWNVLEFQRSKSPFTEVDFLYNCREKLRKKALFRFVKKYKHKFLGSRGHHVI